MKNWFKKHWFPFLIYAVLTAAFIGIVALGMGITKWIVESDLPEWFKMWLIMS